MDSNTDKRTIVQSLLPKSLVFPEYIRAMLLQQFAILTGEQISLLATMLQEEEVRLKEIG